MIAKKLRLEIFGFKSQNGGAIDEKRSLGVIVLLLLMVWAGVGLIGDAKYSIGADQPLSQSVSLEVLDGQNNAPPTHSILFIGNSHTGFHNLPDLVTKLMCYRLGRLKATSGYVAVDHLDGAMFNQNIIQEIESGRWSTVIVQAQKTSTSGKFHYPTTDGVELAKFAIDHGCKVYFYSEWGIRNVPGHSLFTEKIYQSMADESGCDCILVGRVWEEVLSAAPKTSLYDQDGNHQSRIGANLTAIVIASQLLDEDPVEFYDAQDSKTSKSNKDQWKLFCDKASKVRSDMKALQNKSPSGKGE